jgi:glycogen(starch) synthase
MADTLAVVSPWYPSSRRPFQGAFVQIATEAVLDRFDRVEIFHLQEWIIDSAFPLWNLLSGMHDTLVRRTRPLDAMRPGDLTAPARVPTLLRSKRTWADISDRHAHSLRTALGGGRLAADVVHAHTGLPGGWTAVELAEPGARTFITEHATFLDRVLAEPRSRERYEQVIDRCNAFFCVSEMLRQQVLDAFPHHALKVHVAPNAVPFERIGRRETPVDPKLRRWLYVGSFIERKGVQQLLDAFGICAAEDPRLALTMVGEGPLTPALERRTEELGLADRVAIHRPVPPSEILHFFKDNDLLVHPSRYETFGMTVVEAVAAGVPVLVTRCGGPEETLRGIESDAGELVPVTENADELVAGYRRLLERFPSMDLARAGSALQGRYGLRAVGDVLEAYYSGCKQTTEARR